MAVPSVSGVSPTAGPAGGGTVVSVLGAGLTGATAVTFGATAAAFTVDSDTAITAVSPPRGPGVVLVAVRGPGGTSSQLVFFSYQPVSLPVLVAVTPSSGPVGGTTVVLTGTHLSGATAVTFGVTPALSFTVDSATQITAIAPPLAPGAVLVRVVTPVGGSNLLPYFSVGAPVISSLAPPHGPQSGGNTVVISGCDLGLVSSVHFGPTPAPSFTVDSAAQLTAVAPAGTGVVQVTAAGPGGVSSVALYTYLPPPVVTELVPASGPLSGANLVTVFGTALGLASLVTVGGVPASFVAFSDEQLGVFVPASPGPPGAVPVVVTTPGGTSAPVLYTYVGPPG